jgi:signal transduction histidine kinase
VQQVANQCAIAVRQARLYQSSQRQVRELERLNHLKDDFLSTVSHELRTPMANIKVATQMLEVILEPMGVLDATSSAAGRYFLILQNECQREINLINDLLDLTHLQSETEPLLPTAIDLPNWLVHITEPFQVRAQKQQQELTLDIPTCLPTLVTDSVYLERILNELLNNACKYTPTGEVIRVTAHATEETIAICISNKGVEIPEAERDRIFDKFYRIPNHDPWKYSGTGLGLALVKRRTEQLQGTIEVTSKSSWTMFTLQLPWKLIQSS